MMYVCFFLIFDHVFLCLGFKKMSTETFLQMIPVSFPFVKVTKGKTQKSEHVITKIQLELEIQPETYSHTHYN